MNQLDDDVLYRYLNDIATEEDYAILNKWLDANPEHARMLFTLEEEFDAGSLHRFRSLSNMSKARKKLQQRINEKEAIRRPFVLRYGPLLNIAAMITILVAIGITGQIIWSRLQQRESSFIVEIKAGDNLEEVYLPDGSYVVLRQGSTFKYPARFAQDKREVHLSGEGYFEVKHKDYPFIVRTNTMQVRVLGTKFNLESYDNTNFSTATLIEGKVEVMPAHDNTAGVILAPGQMAKLNSKTSQIEISQANLSLATVWVNGRIPFSNATVAEIATTLQDIYKVKIVLADDIDDRTYSGSLKKEDSIESVLKSLQNSIPIVFSMQGNTVYMAPSK